jgi:drug/metabolite transporter (DMT)-like permease
MINLSDAMPIIQLNPIITCILSSIFLGEHLSLISILSIFTSFLGMLLIIRPPFLTNFFMTTIDDVESEFIE